MNIDVLLVDDQDGLRRTLAKVLRKKWVGSRIHEVESAEAGLRALGRVPCDVVISDYNMPPGANGVEFTKQLRHRGYRGLIILWTSDLPEVLAEVLHDPAFTPIEYLAKGSGPDAFRVLIDRHRSVAA